MRFYIADCHFHHSSLNDFMDHRGFSSPEEMNEHMITKWNSRVRSKDEVVILGDFSISTKGEEVNALLCRLNGKKYLIRGNHDRYLNKKDFDSSLFQWVRDYTELNDNGRKIILSHYPVMCYNGQYRLSAKGDPKTYMLYGHVHNTFDEYLVNEMQNITRSRKRMLKGYEEPQEIPCQMINCFCMFSDYVPLTLEEWIEADRVRREKIRLEDYQS